MNYRQLRDVKWLLDRPKAYSAAVFVLLPVTAALVFTSTARPEVTHGARLIWDGVSHGAKKATTGLFTAYKNWPNSARDMHKAHTEAYEDVVTTHEGHECDYVCNECQVKQG